MWLVSSVLPQLWLRLHAAGTLSFGQLRNYSEHVVASQVRTYPKSKFVIFCLDVQTINAALQAMGDMSF